jgi:hypothetical protein
MNDSIFKLIGDGILKQDIVEAAAEIVQAKTASEILKAAQRYKNMVLIADLGERNNVVNIKSGGAV